MRNAAARLRVRGIGAEEILMVGDRADGFGVGVQWDR